MMSGKLEVLVLKNKSGAEASFSNYGARWLSFIVPGKNGCLVDVVLGFDVPGNYAVAEERYHGAVIGRVAGRIKNGIVNIGDKTCQLSINEVLPGAATNHLHGGEDGLSFCFWESRKLKDERDQEAVTFSYNSPCGEGGYIGNLAIQVTYTLTEENAVIIQYSATADQPTPVSLSNHAYFNLSGTKEPTILNHSLQISARKFLEFDRETFCVTGKILPVAKTPMDFLLPKKIGADINRKHNQLIDDRGYNVYYVLDESIGVADAVLESPVSGLRLEIFTTEPGVQLYCAGYWNGKDLGKNNQWYQKYGGIALEPHRYPYCIENPGFPSIILSPEEKYNQVTTYRISNL
jgi:aldose 1-epimerase